MPDHGEYPLLKGRFATQEDLPSRVRRDVGEEVFLEELQKRFGRDLAKCAGCPSCEIEKDEQYYAYRDAKAIRLTATCNGKTICPGSRPKSVTMDMAWDSPEDLKKALFDSMYPTESSLVDAMRYLSPSDLKIKTRPRPARKTDQPTEDVLAGSW